MKADNTIQAIVLAAGASTRFNTQTSKLIAKLCGQELILYPVKTLTTIGMPITLVVGYDKDVIQHTIARCATETIRFTEQPQQRGTGDALLVSRPTWHADHLLVINGDMPLITQEIIEKLCEKHLQMDNAITFVTAHHSEPGGYGRVVRENGKLHIIENRDFTGDVTTYCCINAGIYIFRRSFVEHIIHELKLHENSNEFYITDLIALASEKGEVVDTLQAPFDTIRGVNTLKELWACEHIKRAELISHLMDHGVRFAMAPTVHLDIDVEIGAGTVIESAAQLLQGTKIGKNCTIGPYALLENAILHDNVTVGSHTIIRNAEIKRGAIVGPFAHVHDTCIIEEHAVVGSFVEVVRSTLGPHTKAKHLAYLGDATIGSKSNIGAGTTLCNYNGVHKKHTIIGNETLIGGNNSIVAPVTIGSNVITGAGSTITQDIPNNALAVARAPQTNKENYAPTLLKKYQQETAVVLTEKTVMGQDS